MGASTDPEAKTPTRQSPQQHRLLLRSTRGILKASGLRTCASLDAGYWGAWNRRSNYQPTQRLLTPTSAAAMPRRVASRMLHERARLFCSHCVRSVQVKPRGPFREVVGLEAWRRNSYRTFGRAKFLFLFRFQPSTCSSKTNSSLARAESIMRSTRPLDS